MKWNRDVFEAVPGRFYAVSVRRRDSTTCVEENAIMPDSRREWMARNCDGYDYPISGKVYAFWDTSPAEPL